MSARVAQARALHPRVWSGEDISEQVEELLAAARADGDADGECAALYLSAANASARGRADDTRAVAELLTRRAAETERPVWESIGRHYLARLQLNEGHEDLALNELVLAEVLTDDAEPDGVLSSALNGLAASYSILGLFEDGERIYAQMTPMVRAAPDPWAHEAQVYNRLLNHATWSLALLRVDPAKALEHLERALREIRTEMALMGMATLGLDLEGLLLYADVLTGQCGTDAGEAQVPRLLADGPNEAVSYLHCALAHRLADTGRFEDARRHVADGLHRVHVIEGAAVTTALLWERARIASLDAEGDPNLADVWAYAQHATLQVWELRLRRLEAVRDRLRVERQRREHEHTTRASLEDPLTGVANRRRLAIERTSIATAPTGESIAVAYIDIDEFKPVNDTYGHDVGDRVLQHIAALLGSSIRETDVLARYGGDEFVILARGCHPDDAAALAQRIVTAARTHDWTTIHPDLRISVTVGIAVADHAHDHLFAHADAAMYTAKRAGRDQARITVQTPDGTQHSHELHAI